ncbi:isoprenylcysteine carboxylmethyltransferase family protein [candidate division GN15 bacterium]|nr:isoprenylcysteine carboxylmethyltransferase family protein [candidate division GN15 bacterium]
MILTLIYSVVIIGSAGVLVPHMLSATGYEPLPLNLGCYTVLGLALQGIGMIIYLTSAVDLSRAGRGTPAANKPPKHLVTNGLFANSRNPMYIGLILTILGAAVWTNSSLVLAYALVSSLILVVSVYTLEEPGMTRRFGDAYAAYCRQVPRWFGSSKRRS